MNSQYFPWPGGTDRSIEVSVYNSADSVGPHMHDFVELVYVAQGSCHHRHRNNEMMLIPGDLLVVFPDETHSYSLNSVTVIYNCLFYPGALGEDYERLMEIGGVKCFFTPDAGCLAERRAQDILHLNPADSADVETVLRRMIEEQNGNRSGTGVVQKANLILLVSMLGRLWDNQCRGGAYSFNAKRNQLAEALRIIDRHFGDELSVAVLASSVYMSPDHFRKLFKETTGLSVVDYINRVRIAKSIRLLGDRGNSIGAIAEMVGIADVNYFSRLFHAKLGCTPSEYRRKTGIC